MARPRLDSPNYRLTQRGATFYVQWWEAGAARRVSTGEAERRRAEAFLAQFAAGRGAPEPPAEPTISDILDGYLTDRKPVVRHFERLEMAAKPLRRHLGDLLPEHLGKERARFYRARRKAEGHTVGPIGAKRKKPISDGTVIKELGMLRVALTWARRAKWLTGDVPYIELPPQPPPRDRWLTRDEAARLIECALAPHVRAFLAVALFTAGRSGAVRELTWDRVDMESGLIDLGHAPGGKQRAVVPIADRLRPFLIAARELATCQYVVEHGGRPVASVKTGTRAAARRAQLEHVTPHVLRHTAATWMAMAGVPMEQIGRLLGHRDIRMTWRIYAKHTPDYLRGAIAALSG